MTSVPFSSYRVNDFSQLTGPNLFYGVEIDKDPNLNKPICVHLLPLDQTQSVGSPGYSDHNNNNRAQITGKVYKGKRGEVQKHSIKISSPKMPNIRRERRKNKELRLSTEGATLGITKDAKPEDRHTILSKGPFILESANYAKQKNEDDLDLSLHL